MENINPFDSFQLPIKILIWAGFYEIQSNSKCVQVSHNIYRIFMLLYLIAYNMVHLLYVSMIHDDIGAITYNLVIEIPQMNLFTKACSMLVHARRIRHLNQLISGPTFAAKNKGDEEHIKQNNEDMRKIARFLIVSVSIACPLWLLTFVLKRIEDPEAIVPIYLPFDSKSTMMGYILGVLVETFPVYWIGHAHLMLDLIIAIYYSQATAQLKVFKYNLEHIFDNDDSKNVERHHRFRYIDATDNMRQRLVSFVEKYKKIMWYINEVTYIFEKSMSVQFFTATLSSCLVIYQLSTMNIFSFVFMHMFFVLLIFQCQVFLYCYFAYLAEFESKSINTAMYFSDWLSVSPRLRRDMLIAMTRWGTPLRSRVSTIVPVSVVTFVSIVKSAYRLYTVMKSTHL